MRVLGLRWYSQHIGGAADFGHPCCLARSALRGWPLAPTKRRARRPPAPPRSDGGAMRTPASRSLSSPRWAALLLRVSAGGHGKALVCFPPPLDPTAHETDSHRVPAARPFARPPSAQSCPFGPALPIWAVPRDRSPGPRRTADATPGRPAEAGCPAPPFRDPLQAVQ